MRIYKCDFCKKTYKGKRIAVRYVVFLLYRNEQKYLAQLGNKDICKKCLDSKKYLKK